MIKFILLCWGNMLGHEVIKAEAETLEFQDIQFNLQFILVYFFILMHGYILLLMR